MCEFFISVTNTRKENTTTHQAAKNHKTTDRQQKQKGMYTVIIQKQRIRYQKQIPIYQ